MIDILLGEVPAEEKVNINIKSSKRESLHLLMRTIIIKDIESKVEMIPNMRMSLRSEIIDKIQDTKEDTSLKKIGIMKTIILNLATKVTTILERESKDMKIFHNLVAITTEAMRLGAITGSTKIDTRG
tara:strand:+ start:599 stop:982 length:384 start_codon:yes stop_codon:yes gene_type:complete